MTAQERAFSRAVTTEGGNTMAARLSAQNAKTIFGVVVGYSLDEARQHLAVGWFAFELHEPFYSVRAMRFSKQRAGGNFVDSAAQI